jgi:predicted PurR-regulated permease PerM
MKLSRVVEYVFFFGLLLLAGYMVWLIMAPFVGALALAAIIVTICHPLHERIVKKIPYQNRTFAAFITTMLVLVVIIIPLILISSLVVREVVSFYQELDSGGLSIQSSINQIESTIQYYIPAFEVDLTKQIQLSAEWFTGNLGAIFAGTVSTVFAFFIALIGSFYFFRDGKELLELVIKASPLPDDEDRVILNRLGRAIRAVATGTVLVALIQGSLVAIGFTLFGIERAVLFGSIASVGALMPGVGTTIVTAPAILYLFISGDTVNAIGLAVWSVLIVGFVDNLIGPYLMSRGNNMHPFIILIAVLGGLSLFGPIGFVVGPVVVTLFLVLLELYNQYIVKESSIKDIPDYDEA